MKPNLLTLFPSAGTAATAAAAAAAARVLEYAAARTTALPAPLRQHHARLCRLERAHMTVSASQAQALGFLARMVGAKRVLEIGVFRGFSAMVWAHAVGPDGHVTGLEVLPAFAQAARQGFAELGIHNAEVVVGDALQTLDALDPDEPYDLVFLDAQKTGYPAYLASLLRASAPGAPRRLLRPGGLIVADNVLRGGRVVDYAAAAAAAGDQPDHSTGDGDAASYNSDSPASLRALDAFNTAMHDSPRIDVWLVPLFDGLGIGRLVD